MQVINVASQPGIQRDGTDLASKSYNDGQWCRFQRGLPRKMGGYRVTQPYLTAISRALFSQARNGFRYFSSGHRNGIDQFTIDNFGVSSTVSNPALPGFTPDPTKTWQFDTQFDNASAKTLLFAFAGNNLLDPTTATNFTPYYADVYTPGAAMTALTGSNIPVGVSGGICSLAPYMTVFGNDGFWAWSNPGLPTDFSTAAVSGATRITSSKILKGLPLRGGGGNSPAGLYWSVDAVVRVNFVGGTTTWQFDQLTTQSSVLSDRCIIENDGIFYWVGVDRFLMYNGVVQEIPNSMNLNWFFDGINQAHAAKSFVMKITRYGEIWWCYPRAPFTECSHAVIYNYREKFWYDTVLPNTGRSSGLHSDNLVGNMMGGMVPTLFTPDPLTSVATSSGGNAVYTGTISGGADSALAGFTFTVSGFSTTANNGTFTVIASTATTLTLNNPSAVAGSATATATQASFLPLWQHEIGTDEINGTNQASVLSYFTTSSMSQLTSTPPKDSNTTVQAMQPDFIQSGDLTVTVIKQNNAKDAPYDGVTAIIYGNPDATADPELNQLTNFKDSAKILQLKFQSNAIGGNYQLGATMLEVGSDGDRDT